MSDNYLRSCQVYIAALGKTYTVDGIRVRFSIKQATLAVPNTATIRLTNMLRSDAEKLAKDSASEGTLVTISAGYQGNIGLLFQGHIANRGVIYGRENPTDTLCHILCTDGNQAMAYATINKQFPAGSTPKDHLDEAIKAFKQYGVGLGFVGPAMGLLTPIYPRAVTLFGMARKVIDDIANSKRATWGIQNLMVNLMKPSESLPGAPFVLNSRTGLIGMPTLTPEGVYVRSLINPQFKIDGLVKIDQSSIQGYLPQLGPTGEPLPQFSDAAQGIVVATIAADGIYRIVKIDVETDTRGQPWYMDMVVLRPGENTHVSRDAEAGQQRYQGQN